MARRQPQPRRSAEYAWFITGPLALLAVVWSTGVGILSGDPLGSWPVAIFLLAIMVASEIPNVYFVIRRQAVVFTLAEIPLVLALYFLPSLTVVLTATSAALITQLHRRLSPAKFWFNVAKTRCGHLAGLAVAVGAAAEAGRRSGHLGHPLRRGRHDHLEYARGGDRRDHPGAGQSGRPGGVTQRPADPGYRHGQRRDRPDRADRALHHLVVGAAVRRARRRSGPGLPVVRAILPAAPHAE